MTNQSKFDQVSSYIKEKFNQIQVRIISIFLVLIFAASLTIIFINYIESKKAVIETSLTTTRQIGLGVIENIDALITNIQIQTTLTASLVDSADEVSGTNHTVVHYLINSLFNNPIIAGIKIAGVDGSFLGVSNLTLTKQTQYRFDMTKHLPEGVRYAITTISKNGNSWVEEWKYLDTDFQLKGSEQTSPPTFDPRLSPWYTEVATWPRIVWSEPYNISPNAEGITFALPIIENDSLLAIVGTDVAFSELSTIIDDTVVGKTGEVYVLNNFGEIVLPQAISGTIPYIIAEGYNEYTKTNKKNFILNVANNDYVIEVFIFPLDLNTTWLIMSAVPLSDFFDPILKSDIHSIEIGFLILLIAGWLIYFASGKIAKPINELAVEVEKIKDFNFSDSPNIQSNIYEISLLSYSIQTMKKTFESFTKYVPKDIVKRLLEQDHPLTTGGERKTMSILFSDIENFTTVTESLSVEQVNTALTEYFEVFTKIILENQGTIDKYIGDSVMAIWNAPVVVVDHAEKACLACLDFLALLKTSTFQNPFLKGNTRFGINTGEAIVGNIGTTERISYTAIGTIVNTASRFQSLNKVYNTSIIIGESVKGSLTARFITRPLDFLAVKGRNQQVQIFELMGIKEGEPKAMILNESQIALCEEFAKAFTTFHKGDVVASKKMFEELNKKYPNDVPTKIYLQRLDPTNQCDLPLID